jgi:3,4-dihydroxy 2-butanone 4-phosphate synthase / GTP cyclohydrolase II
VRWSICTMGALDLVWIKGVTPARVMFHREQRLREKSEERAHRTLQQVGLRGQILSDLGIHKIRLLTNTPTRACAAGVWD